MERNQEGLARLRYSKAPGSANTLPFWYTATSNLGATSCTAFLKPIVRKNTDKNPSVEKPHQLVWMRTNNHRPGQNWLGDSSEHAKSEPDTIFDGYIAFSSMSSSSVNKIIKSLPVVTLNGNEPDVSKKNTIPPFQWDTNRNEDQQVQEYSAYIQSHLCDVLNEKGLCLVDATVHPHLLDVTDDRFDFDLSGTTDLVVLKDLGAYTMKRLHHCEGLRLVIELKSELSSEFGKKEAQALVELIAANVKVPHMSPVVLLTDLRHEWVFMWLSEDFQIRQLILQQPANAFWFIRRFLAQNDDDISIPNPLTRSPRIPMRGNIDKLFPPVGSSIGEMIERCRSIGSESFLDWSIEREIGRKVVQGMPAYASMLREKASCQRIVRTCMGRPS